MVILFWGIACFGFSLGSFETRFEGFDWSARWNLNSAHSQVFNFCENSKISTFYLFLKSFFGSKVVGLNQMNGSSLKWTALDQSERSIGVELDGPNDSNWTV